MVAAICAARFCAASTLTACALAEVTAFFATPAY